MTAAASHTGPQSGWVLDGRYALDAPIGVGGTATVWRATHLRLHQPVAVKFLRDPADPALRERFMHEAQTAAAVRHRHVVEVIDVEDALSYRIDGHGHDMLHWCLPGVPDWLIAVMFRFVLVDEWL